MAIRSYFFAICFISSLSSHAALAPASEENLSRETPRCFIVELYVSDDSKETRVAKARIEKFVSANPGYKLNLHDIEDDELAWERLSRICRHFKLDESTPKAYGGGMPFDSFSDEARLVRALESIATLTVYVRTGCPHCQAAKKFLPEFTKRYPGIRIKFRDIAADPRANEELQSLVRRHRTSAASVPVFHACNQLSVGFTDASNTGSRLHAILKPWTVPCPRHSRTGQSTYRFDEAQRFGRFASIFPFVATSILQEVNSEVLDEPPLPDLPLPADAEGEEPISENEIDLPVFGRLKLTSVGLPLFTIAVGLVDGFNPCAMWVLLFLLSVLVNLHSRWKILAVAGTFVVISAAAYFAFMAAWFSVFRFVGVLRGVQMAIAGIAICIGLIHIKDFFAFKQGITLSIPESAKPGIYERIRRIVTAENLIGAIIATSVLAVLVNTVELLCTAGLPALYTQILNAQQLPAWQNYAYLLLYDMAYMFDDGLMVAIVVITLERHKLQEKQGRWLKLLSGTAILVLGVIMLVRPAWLGM